MSAFYPVNLRLEGRKCLVIGGGTVAERKVKALLAAGAQITVLSPEITSLLSALVSVGSIAHIAAPYQTGRLGIFFIVICATNNAAVNRLAAEEAGSKGALVNVADAPELGDFIVPAHIVHGDLLITVSTGGKSPALARRLREELAARYGPEYGAYLEVLSRLRAELKEQLATAEERNAFWREALSGEVLALLAAGNMQEAEEKIRNAASRFRAKS
jgi:precorrin-2 dehydrogenase/sirohydrochlorin ferrochelatase